MQQFQPVSVALVGESGTMETVITSGEEVQTVEEWEHFQKVWERTKSQV
ncbi:MAG: hypothetical protein LIP12_06100 [Clostridiales bacterium]|nr:hypothetical protein [Clostridiales bacterium]